ncbi:hypothetical protein N6H05_14700 [Sphingobium sp. WTD-1]|uniref:hypothetical protein n=1 Tax=Sphingobium sp. WTD-1 TaxID=2979467 RepID=UPI0024DE90BD|nr:hypothetical protein [Sphingobium sp. WTD-1]WIA54313.1 hypothetical protein N6H05_14700 [Sphingobium sp. WTD-1]
MIDLLAESMEVPENRRSAMLGRFQHLQRLSLIDGINPGRGRAAEYRAHQVLVVAVAFEMLQLGLSPERVVQTIKANQDAIRLAIGLAVGKKGEIQPSVIWFDPAIVNGAADGFDPAEATFDYGGEGSAVDRFKWFVSNSWVERMAVISISGTLWHIIAAAEGHSGSSRPPIGPTSLAFLDALHDWYRGSAPDSLT